MSVFRSPGKGNTCGLARGTNLIRGTAALYDVQFAILRSPADPQLGHCRDALERKRNGSHPVRYLVVVCVHKQQPAKDTLKECECKFGELAASSTASIWPTTPYALVDSGNSLPAGATHGHEVKFCFVDLWTTVLPSQQFIVDYTATYYVVYIVDSTSNELTEIDLWCRHTRSSRLTCSLRHVSSSQVSLGIFNILPSWRLVLWLVAVFAALYCVSLVT